MGRFRGLLTLMDVEGLMSENSVLQVLNSYKKAVYEKNVEDFVALYDQDIHVFDMWGQWSHHGLAVWRKMAEEWFGSLGVERVAVDFEDIKIKTSDKLAYASAFAKFAAVANDGQVIRYLQNRLTCVLELKNGQWKIIHEHTSGPINHETLKVSLKRS